MLQPTTEGILLMRIAGRRFHIQTIIPLFAENPSHPFAPLIYQPAAARSTGQGRPLGRRPGALPLMGASTVAGWRRGRTSAFSVVALCAVLVPVAPAHGQTMTMTSAPPSAHVVPSFDSVIAEASQRFDIPASWIRGVMDVESGGNVSAVSPRGALGLMQLMPATYAAMRLRFQLGDNPFDPHDNIIAGTAYLREMLDCYGMAGFLVAYNAGPAQYDAYLATGVPLPAETRAYVARLMPMLAGEPRVANAATSISVPNPLSWRQAPLFARASRNAASAPSGSGASANPLQLDALPNDIVGANSIADLAPPIHAESSLFISASAYGAGQ